MDCTTSAAQMCPGGGALPRHHLHLAYWGSGSQYLAGMPVTFRKVARTFSLVLGSFGIVSITWEMEVMMVTMGTTMLTSCGDLLLAYGSGCVDLGLRMALDLR